MIPTIKKLSIDNIPEGIFWSPYCGKVAYLVKGKHGCDLVPTLGKAIRYWLWHCGVPARIAFRKYRSNETRSKTND